MNFDFQNMSTYQMDVLREVSNIGAGNAATALSKLVKKRIDMGVPRIELLEFSEVGGMLGDEEKLVCGVIVQVEGTINGMLLLILEYEDTGKLLEHLLHRQYQNLDELDEIAFSAIKETGNILSGAYMAALAKLTNLDVKCNLPYISIDMAAAILSLPAIGFGEIADRALYIDSDFDEDQSSGQSQVKARMFLVLEANSFEILLRALGAIK